MRLPISEYAAAVRLPVWMVADAAKNGQLDGWMDDSGIRADTPRALCVPSARMPLVSISCYAKRWHISPVRILTALLVAGERGQDYIVQEGKIRIRNVRPEEFRASLADILFDRGAPRARRKEASR